MTCVECLRYSNLSDLVWL